MTLQEFKALLLTIDPAAKHFQGPGSGDYTVWSEYDATYMVADDNIVAITNYIQVDRFTRHEYDPMVEAITQGLDVYEVVLRDRRTIYEPDTGYIHHIWDVEVSQWLSL